MEKMTSTSRRILLALALTLGPALLFAQQDPQLSLYMFDKMAVDPAAAGSKDAMQASLISRDQWLGIPGAPVTNALMLQAPFSSQKVGWGVELMNDKIGPTNSTFLQGNYAYHLRLLNGQLSMGLGIGLYDYVIDFSQIDYKDKNDMYNTYNRSQTLAPNADFGLYYYSNSFYVGASLNHIIESKLTSENFDSAASFKPHVYFIMGQGFQFSPNFLFSPSLMIKLAQNSPPTGDLNLDVLLQQKLWLGVGYRSDYGLIFMAAFRASPTILIGYSYDLGLNAIGIAGGGTHEICLTIDFGKHKTIQASPRYF